MMSLFSTFRLMLFVIVVPGTVFWTCSDEQTKPPLPVFDEPEDTMTTSHDFQFSVSMLGDGASVK